MTVLTEQHRAPAPETVQIGPAAVTVVVVPQRPVRPAVVATPHRRPDGGESGPAAAE